MHRFAFLPAISRGSNFFTSSPIHYFPLLKKILILVLEWVRILILFSHYGFDLHFPNDLRCWTSLFFYILAVVLKKCLWNFLPIKIFKIVYLWILKVSHIMDRRPLSDIWLVNGSSHSVGCLFVKVFNFDVVQFYLVVFAFGVMPKKSFKVMKCTCKYHLKP